MGQFRHCEMQLGTWARLSEWVLSGVWVGPSLLLLSSPPASPCLPSIFMRCYLRNYCDKNLHCLLALAVGLFVPYFLSCTHSCLLLHPPLPAFASLLAGDLSSSTSCLPTLHLRQLDSCSLLGLHGVVEQVMLCK